MEQAGSSDSDSENAAKRQDLEDETFSAMKRLMGAEPNVVPIQVMGLFEGLAEVVKPYQAEIDFSKDRPVQTDPPQFGIRKFCIAKRIEENMIAFGFRRQRPVQEAVWHAMLRLRNVVVEAESACGKTTSFTIPIVNRLWLLIEEKLRHSDRPFAVVLGSTEQHCQQIAALFRTLCHLTRIRVVSSVDVPENGGLCPGCEILVTTAKKAKSYLANGSICPQMLKVVVIDDADLMLKKPATWFFARTLFDNKKCKQQFIVVATTTNVEFDEFHKTFLSRNTTVVKTIGSKLNSKLKLRMIDLADKDPRRLLSLLRVSPEKTLIFVHTVDECQVLATYLTNLGLRGVDFLTDDHDQQVDMIISFRSSMTTTLIAAAQHSRFLNFPDHFKVVVWDTNNPLCKIEMVHQVGKAARFREGKAYILTDGYKPFWDQMTREWLLQMGQRVPRWLMAPSRQ